MVTLSIATAILGGFLAVVGLYQMGYAVVDMDPADPDNYGSEGAANNVEEQRMAKEKRGEAMTEAWFMTSAGIVVLVIALTIGLFAPPASHKHR